ncbi:MAG: SlyX family protein [Gammaproteobacteria bacterium]
MSQELIDLQMKMMHQQEELESMSNTVIRQGKEIDKLNMKLEEFKARLDDIAAGGSITPVDEKPPHY